VSVHLRVDAEDLLRCRFAVSPLWETVAAVRTLADPRRQAYHLPWLKRVHDRVDAAVLEPLLALLPNTGYTPDFLTPPPVGPLENFGDELARVAATPIDHVADELGRSLTGPERGDPAEPEVVARLLADPVRTLDELVAVLHGCWTTLLADEWPALRDLLDNDIAVRSRHLANGGLRQLMANLHHTVRWDDGVLRVAAPYRMSKNLGGQGLLLMPSAFVWPATTVVVEPPWQPTLIYPVRGIDELWRRPAPQSDRALRRLVGRTRADILINLDEAASTTALGRLHDVSPATVSGHLAALRDAGLVVGHRVGYTVLYERTGLGSALCGKRPGVEP
jgi:DNA-binding transcriptional ArsR family regulator